MSSGRLMGAGLDVGVGDASVIMGLPIPVADMPGRGESQFLGAFPVAPVRPPAENVSVAQASRHAWACRPWSADRLMTARRT